MLFLETCSFFLETTFAVSPAHAVLSLCVCANIALTTIDLCDVITTIDLGDVITTNHIVALQAMSVYYAAMWSAKRAATAGVEVVPIIIGGLTANTAYKVHRRSTRAAPREGAQRGLLHGGRS